MSKSLRLKTGVQLADTFMGAFEERLPTAHTPALTTIRCCACNDRGTAAGDRAAGAGARRHAQDLQSVIEQQEAANEELQSANQEVHS